MLNDVASSALILLHDGQDYWWQRRAFDDDSYPSCLDFAAGGSIESGETPRAAALRELEEELGISGLALEALGTAQLDGECCVLFRGALPVCWRLGSEVAELLPMSLEALRALPPAQRHPQLNAWLGKDGGSGS
jgi:8-oxo-dGTP pyrophosphatase MutT (NUDIX family)